jgi:hypothetical protein
MSASGASAAVKSLFNSFTQGTRLIQLTTPAGPNQLLVECVRAEEGISQGYRLQIAALSTDAAIPRKSLIGQPVLLELLTVAARILTNYGVEAADKKLGKSLAGDPKLSGGSSALLSIKFREIGGVLQKNWAVLSEMSPNDYQGMPL